MTVRCQEDLELRDVRRCDVPALGCIAGEGRLVEDAIVTMGCGDACPAYPGKRYLDWELDDPAGKPVEEVRGVRDDIEGRVRALLDDLGVSTVIPN